MNADKQTPWALFLFYPRSSAFIGGHSFTSFVPPRSPPAPARSRHRWAAPGDAETARTPTHVAPSPSDPATAYFETYPRSGTRASTRSPAACADTSRGSPPPAYCESAPPPPRALLFPLRCAPSWRENRVPLRRYRTGTAARTTRPQWLPVRSPPGLRN